MFGKINNAKIFIGLPDGSNMHPLGEVTEIDSIEEPSEEEKEVCTFLRSDISFSCTLENPIGMRSFLYHLGLSNNFCKHHKIPMKRKSVEERKYSHKYRGYKF